ncbi:MAG: hypothetical protein M0R22_11765 [Dehalococcoidia bacterium]|jgi:hypothetical protein|nr:hypothetical protein [Dehalococcoidia bacterium]
MASTYAGTATAPGSLTIPDDGDNATAASVNTPIEALQDSILFLNRNPIIDFQHVAAGTIDFSPAGYMSVSGSTDWQAVTDGATPMAVTITEDLAAGDIIEIHAHVQASTDGVHGGALRINVYYNFSDHVVTGSGVCVAVSQTSNCYSWTCRHVMAGAETGPIVVRIEAASADAGTTMNIEDTGISLSTTVIRPG